MPRLFTGLEIPEAVTQQLALFRGGLPGARWVDPTDLHITLRFLGDIDTDTANEVHALLEEARPRAPLAIDLDGLAIFGGTKPRAVYAAVAANAELADLQAEHERIARHAGLEPEPRKFTPHVTLARLNRSTGAEAVAHYLSQTGGFSRIGFIASRVALFSARASRGGGPYVVETAYPFVLGAG
ncbi:RNA 2',3'-cyclic phosphodiesterase [Methylobacterium haplocladii]|uniref:RNA 2',3'-cyclic phosphodiesterase n=1 Tax=Methylobacterium haplocladii TaxID=1176176 RepID=A0A512ILM7_9HYPH|nr:RNA 2',3'-cyclic phosphodiesterase [Methylobacterium haplocladii]GEO98626.1 RNA 2',3'-cyclic phosphodiesterase [Methylobacterium haplocladii]GJD83973.1 RNA 2',3'-cyclic phosphodiesterase [Methylobacterium haplocladii]GLS59479.1 RNA 2',3'-cyclic phosphodiesterase [Methylobacterium haplocladii]